MFLLLIESLSSCISTHRTVKSLPRVSHQFPVVCFWRALLHQTFVTHQPKSAFALMGRNIPRNDDLTPQSFSFLLQLVLVNLAGFSSRVNFPKCGILSVNRDSIQMLASSFGMQNLPMCDFIMRMLHVTITTCEDQLCCGGEYSPVLRDTAMFVSSVLFPCFISLLLFMGLIILEITMNIHG